jgi:hypothetical protein
MAMPPHVIIIGMPAFIMVIIRSQDSLNMSFMASSIGIISHFIPVGVMVQLILHIIGIGIIMGIIEPIMDIGIIPPIIGMFIIVGIGVAVIDRLHLLVTARSVAHRQRYERGCAQAMKNRSRLAFSSSRSESWRR